MLDIKDYKTISWKVSKGISSKFWTLRAEIDKHVAPDTMKMLQVQATDHRKERHTVFVGIIPDIDYKLATAANKTEIIGHSHAWYLTVQHLPENMRVFDEDQNPSKTITDILGGTAWARTTGIEPYRINTVANWEYEDVMKSFTFTDQTLRWNAIIQIAEYCNFVFLVKWRDINGEWRPCAYFVHEDDIDEEDIGLDLRKMVTITAPDPHLVSGSMVREDPAYRYNRVRASGFSQEENEYYFAVAQTQAVAEGLELANEYIYTDVSLKTKDKTQAKAQEILDFFQTSSTTYRVTFKHRMDLQLYQKIKFVGYSKIDPAEMRITRIIYEAEATNDTVEIEFSKDQPVQHLKRRSAVMRDIHYETFTSDIWEEVGAYMQMIEPHPLNMQGWSLDDVTGVRGPKRADISFWGWDRENERNREFARWRNYRSGEHIKRYLEIREDIVIANDSQFPKIYFDTTTDAPTHIRANKFETLKSLDFTVAGQRMLSLIHPSYEGQDDYIFAMRDLKISQDLRMAGGMIRSESLTGDLVFRDGRAGTKTLSELATGGVWLGGHDSEQGYFVQTTVPKQINMAYQRIRRLADPIDDWDAANKRWCLANGIGGGDGLTNPMTKDLNMGRHDIDNCDDISCDDINCDDINCEDVVGDYIYCKELQTKQISCDNGGIYNVSHINFQPRTSPPSGKTKGMLYFDSYTKTFRYYTGSSWKTIAT